MNLDTMRYFKELAETGTFYGAAKRLFMSQQGLNKAITALEDELGAKLIDRGRRGVSLTPDGSASSPSRTKPSSPTRSSSARSTTAKPVRTRRRPDKHPRHVLFRPDSLRLSGIRRAADGVRLPRRALREDSAPRALLRRIGPELRRPPCEHDAQGARQPQPRLQPRRPDEDRRRLPKRLPSGETRLPQTRRSRRPGRAR